MVWNTVPDRRHGSAFENNQPSSNNQLRRRAIDCVRVPERMLAIPLLADSPVVDTMARNPKRRACNIAGDSHPPIHLREVADTGLVLLRESPGRGGRLYGIGLCDKLPNQCAVEPQYNVGEQRRLRPRLARFGTERWQSPVIGGGGVLGRKTELGT